MLQDPLEALNSWSSNTNKLMDLVMKTTHLINKEEMVHKHLASGAVTAEWSVQFYIYVDRETNLCPDM